MIISRYQEILFIQPTMKNVLITGSAGELGHSLIQELLEIDQQAAATIESITCLDLQAKPEALQSNRIEWKQGSITDKQLVKSLIQSSNFDHIFHLAALLSASAAKNPSLAQEVNIDASNFLINCAKDYSNEQRKKCKFIFPSSIAVYGLDPISRLSAVQESLQSTPVTIYGKHKLEVEEFGSTIAKTNQYFDFRGLRFPGIISADTIPQGGTSDYASLMAHQAAKNEPYACFVSESTSLAFIAMPDAVNALVTLAKVDESSITKSVYNLYSFTVSAKEIAEYTLAAFKHGKISFSPIKEKQEIVDSWPALVDGTAFQRDTGWSASLGKEETFTEYLLPKISARYQR